MLPTDAVIHSTIRPLPNYPIEQRCERSSIQSAAELQPELLPNNANKRVHSHRPTITIARDQTDGHVHAPKSTDSRETRVRGRSVARVNQYREQSTQRRIPRPGVVRSANSRATRGTLHVDAGVDRAPARTQANACPSLALAQVGACHDPRVAITWPAQFLSPRTT